MYFFMIKNNPNLSIIPKSPESKPLQSRPEGCQVQKPAGDDNMEIGSIHGSDNDSIFIDKPSPDHPIILEEKKSFKSPQSSESVDSNNPINSKINYKFLFDKVCKRREKNKEIKSPTDPKTPPGLYAQKKSSVFSKIGTFFKNLICCNTNHKRGE